MAFQILVDPASNIGGVLFSFCFREGETSLLAPAGENDPETDADAHKKKRHAEKEQEESHGVSPLPGET